MSDKIVVTLAGDGSVLVPCSVCSAGNRVEQRDIQNLTFCCVSCNEMFESPFGRVSVHIKTSKEEWDMLVDESWDVC